MSWSLTAQERAEAIKAAHPLSSIVGQHVDLKRCGQELRGCCPFHSDRTPSFYVNDEKGQYHCFGCGAGGDVIKFVSEYNNMTFNEACESLEGNQRVILAKIDQSPRFSANVDLARKIWDEAGPIKDTPADEYLKRRLIFMRLLCDQENLRFARLPFDGSSELHPALVAAVRDVHGTIIGIQRTYLTEDGDKLCPDAKRSLGQVKGGAIRLSAGEEKGDFSTLYITEGAEDGLSILLVERDAPVWVTAGAGMMKHVELPASCSTVRIVADNDEAGYRAATQLGAQLVKSGVRVELSRLHEDFKDYNEYLGYFWEQEYARQFGKELGE